MAIQVINMKYSNEQVIAEVGEVYHDKDSKEKGEKPICLEFTDPYTPVSYTHLTLPTIYSV